MALSAAEKQRRYRERRDKDPERRATYLQKQKERHKIDKEMGKCKSVSEMTAREKRKQRRYWRQKQKLSRQKRKALDDVINATPPQSPEQNLLPLPSRQYSQAKKQRLQNNRKLKRETTLLQSKLRKAEKRAEMYRKRWERLKELHHSNLPDTPRTKTAKLLRSFSTKNVRKALDFHHALLAQLRENSRKRTKKRILDNLITGSIMKKYGLSNCIRREIGIPMQRKPTKQNGSLRTKLQIKVRNFFERDDVSRITSGKKQTVTHKKTKKQKRLLNDTIHNIYDKYVAETNDQLSFTSFWRLKPFWVKSPSQSDRETCVCKTCDNISMIADSLFGASVIDTPNLNNIMNQVVCSKENQSCMYGLCPDCKGKEITILDHEECQQIKWQEWKTIKEVRTIKREKESKTKEVSVTKKMLQESTVEELVEKFKEALIKYKQHQFNIHHQYSHYRKIKSSIANNECLMHIDFSENYVGKLAKEASSMHYGASQVQITLHTGFYQVGSARPVSFATVSDSLKHGPAAIWALISPVLTEMKRKNPDVDYIHFYSDGPSTQYRQKNNFYLLSTEIFQFGFKGASWNFHEAGHGKGIPDGIGGTLKRAADRRVLFGSDITKAKDLLTEIENSGTKISLYEIEEENIQYFETKLDGKIPTVPGTLKIHQVFVIAPGEITYRDLSCFCSVDTCNLHSLKHFKFPKESQGAVIPDQPKQTEDLFSCYLQILRECETLQEIQNHCKSFTMNSVCGKPRSILVDKLAVDYKALDLYPDDCDSSIHPIDVKADGDCLPACGSIYLYGNDEHSEEVRVRIIAELAVNIDYYLDEENLKKGVQQSEDNECLKKTFAMFSNEFIPGIHLTDDTIRMILESEIKSICKPKSYMGIWQIFALASVLQMPVFGIYPDLGETFYRKYLQRLILPRVSSSDFKAVIMWTSTRGDMAPINWIPNHFVPVLPIEIQKINTETMKDEDEVTIEVFFVDEYKNGSPLPNFDKQSSKELGEDPEENDCISDVKGIPEPDFDKEANKEIGEDQEEENSVGDSNDQNETEDKKLEGLKSEPKREDTENEQYTYKDYLGKHVIVSYDGIPYPGIVKDLTHTDAYVECMKRRKNSNTFSWPKRNRDICWYKFENILTVIPQQFIKESPMSHFEIEPSVWEKAVRKLDA